MAGVPNEALVKITGWRKGLDNINNESSVPIDALRLADNIDLDRGAQPKRRSGYAKVISGTRTHSLWSDPNIDFGLYVDNGIMFAIADDLSTQAIRSDLDPFLEVSYCRVNRRVYWSNGKQSGAVEPGAGLFPTSKTWGCECPNGQPIVTNYTSGGLRAGNYQVAVSFLTAEGEESGSTLAALVTVADGGGIQLSSIPQPVSSDVLWVRVYCSPTDGDMLYHRADIPVGMTTYLMGVGFAGKPLETQFLRPMPSGHIVRFLNGRLYVAEKNRLWFSSALRYGLCHSSQNYISFPDEVTVLQPSGEAANAGLYVAAGARTYWLGGSEPAQFQQVIAYPHGGVKGTGITIPASIFGLEISGYVGYWIASNGAACLGLPGGLVQPFTESTALAPAAERGASMFREVDGYRHIVTTLTGRKANGGFIPIDRAVATVYRNDIVIDP